MKQRGYAILMTFCLVAALAILCADAQAAAKKADIRTVNRAELQELIRKEKGKVVAVSLFATWCPYCKDEVPEYIKLRNAFPEKDLALFCLSLDRAAGDLAFYLGKHEVNYPFLLAEEDIYDLLRALDIRRLPHLLLFNRSGELAKSILGFQREKELTRLIKETLAE